MATNRPAVAAWFSAIPRPGVSIAVDWLPLRPEVIRAAAAVARADVAVVDLDAAPLEALDVCRDLLDRRPGLPMAVFSCCTGGLTSWHLQTLRTAGVRGVLDLGETLEAVGWALLRLARGQPLWRLPVRHDGVSVLPVVRVPRRSRADGVQLGMTDTRVLSKLAQGLSDREIAARLHRSPHTIKHYVERLREAVGARNRIELAAWAGRHGFDQPSAIADAAT